jgi:CheY-like chemotaxis protein
MSNERVLIVEDEFAIAEVLEMALTDDGYRVMIAANGRQGLECLAQDPPPDLVISDFMMPVLDGARFLHAMRETEAHRNIPCIIMSSAPEASVRRQIEGYAGFIRKPFRLADMVQLVEGVLGTQGSAGGETPG